MVIWIWHLLSVSVVVAVNYHCTSSPCTACTGGEFLYNDTSCLVACPTGFGSLGSDCTCPSPCTPNLFSQHFYKYLDFSTNTAGIFTAPATSFDDVSQLSPIPTKERGFYFDITSSIYSTSNLILGPDFSFSLLFRVYNCTLVTDCLVLSVDTPTNIFKIEVNSGELIATWLISDSTTAATSSKVITTDFEFGIWQKVIFGSRQATGSLTITQTFIDTFEYATHFETISSKEFRNQVSATFTFGSAVSTSFNGFIYDAHANNYVITDYQISAFLINCEYNEYYINPQCKPCDASCPTWPWCTHSGTCGGSDSGSCYSQYCTTCTGFKYSDCQTCSNGLTPGNCDCWKFCLTCTSTFVCDSCSDRYTLIDGLCIYEPYNWGSTGPAIALKFDVFQQYYDDLFQSGHDGTTYAPYHYPESDDPIPAMNRGLYFNYTSKLKSITAISLSTKNTFLIWAKPEADGFNFWNAPSMLLFSSASASYLLTDSYTWARFNTYDVTDTTDWTFYAFIHDFTAGVTTCKIMLNNVVFSTTTINGFALYDIKTTVWILGQGFFFSLNAYNSAVADPTSEYQNGACGVGQVSSCLSDCGIDEYNNAGICTPCDSECTSGCTQSGGCSICADVNCIVCDGFGSSLCYSTGSSSCTPIWLDGVYNNCCNENCKNCDGPFQYSCTECYEEKLLLVEDVCVDGCPDRTFQFGGTCQASESLVGSFLFNEIWNVYVDMNTYANLTTGNDTQFYPEIQPSDPIPAINRGLYFTETSYMTSSPIYLSTSFTLVFWIKHKTGGILLQKNSLEIQTGTSISVDLTSQSSFISPGYQDYSWTQTVLQVWNSADNKINALISTLSDKIFSYVGTYDYFLDSPSVITLGHSSGSFLGFIYRFQIYNDNIELYKLSLDTVCESGMSVKCLWDCDIGFYWNGYNCELCDSNCEFGCKDTGYCNICPDIECHYCHDYISTCDVCKTHASHLRNDCQCDARFYWDLSNEECRPCNSKCILCNGPSVDDCQNCQDSHCLDCLTQGPQTCIKCTSGFEVINNLCVACNDLQYYDSENSKCEDCVAPCKNCKSEIVCKNCIENSSMDADGACACDIGFSLANSTCVRNTFIALFSISNQNLIKIAFTEPLSSSLQSSDLTVKVDKEKNQATLTKIDQSTWKLKLDGDSFAEKARVYVNITKVLISKQNSLYVNTAYSALLFVVPLDSTVQQVQDATFLAENSIKVGMAVVFGSSLLIFDPKSFFFFLQVLEMYYYMMIYAVTISPALYGFLSFLNPGSLIPNPMEYILPDSFGVKMTGKLSDFGYSSNLFLLNSGTNIAILIILVFALPLCYLLSNVQWPWLKNRMEKALSSYKYAVISRCFIQMFLEFLLNSCIGIYFTSMGNAVQIFDTVLCGIVFVKFI